MSRFLDRLEQISLGKPAPMGFGAERGPKTPGMALVGLVSGDYSAGAGALAGLTPDAVLFSGVNDLRTLKELAGHLKEELPWGARVSSLTEEDAQAYEDGGCDLVAFPLEGTPVSAVASETMARVLCVEPDVQLEQLRAIDALPIDALLLSMAGVSAPWTLKDLAAIAGVSRRVDKHVLVEVSQVPAAKDLEAFRIAGVNGLVVDVGAVAAPALAELKAALLAMPRVPVRRRQRVTAILPSSVFFPGGAPGPEEEPPEEEPPDEEE